MQRRGLTITEVLVAISILGLLAALLTPAVQVSREASRRTQCQSHLRQLGIALQSYESQYRCFPRASHTMYHLLPFVGHADVYALHGSTANFHDEDREDEFWRPLRSLVVPLYACPSDSAPVLRGSGDDDYESVAGANYFGCSGSGYQRDGFNGLFSPDQWVRPSEVRDGLSNTAAMSESLRGATTERRRAIWYTPRQLSGPNELDAFADLCESIPLDPVSYGWQGDGTRGYPWHGFFVTDGLYNHVLPPNRPSCTNNGLVNQGAFTAGSLHPGGVHVLYADGRVSFVSEGIDRTVWREAGSRVARVPLR